MFPARSRVGRRRRGSPDYHDRFHFHAIEDARGSGACIGGHDLGSIGGDPNEVGLGFAGSENRCDAASCRVERALGFGALGGEPERLAMHHEAVGSAQGRQVD